VFGKRIGRHVDGRHRFCGAAGIFAVGKSGKECYRGRALGRVVKSALVGADRITHRVEPSLGFGYRF
jgi:hypothetical protein